MNKKAPAIDAWLSMGDLTDFITPHPEIERLAALREKASTCIAFLSYLECIGCVIHPPTSYPVNVREILCDFFGINQQALKQEKVSLLMGAPCHEKEK